VHSPAPGWERAQSGSVNSVWACAVARQRRAAGAPTGWNERYAHVGHTSTFRCETRGCRATPTESGRSGRPERHCGNGGSICGPDHLAVSGTAAGSEMIGTASLYEACHDLFRWFPVAVRKVGRSGTILSMVLMLRDGDDAQFFVLAQSCGDERALFSVSLWPAGDFVDIEPEGRTAVPDLLASAITRGVPLPRHGSVFGWPTIGVITSIVVTYTDYAPERPLPRWTVMPLADIEASDWPPFTGRHLFGPWFWELYNSGRVLLLDSVIADNPGTVFWIDTHAVLGADCCAVARDIKDPQGRILRRGRYVYSELLRSRAPVPSLTALLADSSKTDLAPRFRRHAHDEGCVRT
jgi:hypothetical protein